MVSKVYFFDFISLPPVVQLWWLWRWRFFWLKGGCIGGASVSFEALTPVHIKGPRSHLKLQKSFPPSHPLPTACPKGSCLRSKEWSKCQFSDRFLRRASVSGGSVVCPGGSVLCPSRVCVFWWGSLGQHFIVWVSLNCWLSCQGFALTLVLCYFAI